MYIERTITKKLKKSLSSFSSVAITGARQTGKSTLLKNVFGNDYNYLSFDDLLVRERALNDPSLFITELKAKTILDEIQYVPNILSYLKIEIDNNKNQKGKYILTGSQQFSMMKGISETLAGRIALLNLFPLSYSELLQNKNYKKHTESTDSFFKYACLNGLYPELCTNKKLDVKTWYSSYVQTYIERDIKSIYNIGDIRTFGQFIRILASRCSQLINYSELSKDIGVSVNTIKNWMSILEASQIIYTLNPFYENIGKRIIKSSKVYWLDSGLVCYLTGTYNIEQINYGIMSGALFENIVISETIKFLNNNGFYNNIYFLRTSNNQEIDLLIQVEDKIYPFEIKLSKMPKSSMIKPIDNIRNSIPKMNLQKANLVCMIDKSFPLTTEADALNLKEYLALLQNILA
jgi:hypothetical protein